MAKHSKDWTNVQLYSLAASFADPVGNSPLAANVAGIIPDPRG